MTDSKLSATPKSVTIHDIAAQCGLSKSTVSYALQNDSRIRPDTRERVLAAAAALGYDPAAHEAARRLVATRSTHSYLNHLIALYLPSHLFQGNRYFAQMAEGAMDVLSVNGFGILMNYLPTSENSSEAQPPTIFNRGEVDGVIISASSQFELELLRRLRTISAFGERPIISLIWHYPGCFAVQMDYWAGGAASMRHLLALGHRHILILTFPETGYQVHYPDPSNDLFYARMRGIHHAVQEYGLAPLHTLAAYEVPRSWLDPCEIPAHHSPRLHLSTAGDPQAHSLVRYLRDHPEITAICATNDPSAFQAWSVLQAAGWRIPQQISLIGYDDTDPIFDESGYNLLTTVRAPLRAIGAEAARMMLARLAGEPQQDIVTLPPELIVRHSTAAPAV